MITSNKTLKTKIKFRFFKNECIKFSKPFKNKFEYKIDY